MRLTVYTDYALRMLMYLALKDGELATITEVADKYGISRNHLMKVAYQLGAAGYVETVRGRGGGMRMGKDAAAIGLGEIVRHTEPDMALVPCFEAADTSCVIRRCCVLQRALEEARHAFLDVLDEYSLSDLVERPGPLRKLLALAPITAKNRARAKASH